MIVTSEEKQTFVSRSTMEGPILHVVQLRTTLGFCQIIGEEGQCVFRLLWTDKHILVV